MIKFFMLGLLSIFMLSCQGQTEATSTVLSPEAFYRKIVATPQVQLIDVRTAQEYASQHLSQAVNININGGQFEQQVAQFDKTKPIMVYCMVGGRSKQAASKLVDMGFKEVYDLEGGIMKWNADGYAKPAEGGLTQADFDKLTTSDNRVLASFFAEWCGPCKKMAPYMQTLENNQTDDVKVIRLDADKHKALAQKLQIEALPTLLLYENGKLVWKHIGYLSEEDLKKKINGK